MAYCNVSSLQFATGRLSLLHAVLLPPGCMFHYMYNHHLQISCGWQEVGAIIIGLGHKVRNCFFESHDFKLNYKEKRYLNNKKRIASIIYIYI